MTETGGSSMDSEYEVPSTKRMLVHPMSKTAYRVRLLGMCVRVMRSFLFNVAVFFAGAAIGMGFTVIHVQKAWKDKYNSDTIAALERAIDKHNIHDKGIDGIILKMKNERADNIEAVPQQ